jgi:hypothetical protein
MSNLENFASVTNPADVRREIDLTEMRDYTHVHFGDSTAYVPLHSKFYASIMRSLMSAAIECPGNIADREEPGLIFIAMHVQVSNAEMLSLISRIYENPVLPTQAAVHTRTGKTSARYLENVGKFRTRRKKARHALENNPA